MTNKPMLSVELQLTEQQERDLTRFYDTCEDSQPYDVPKDRMKSLACVGLVRSLGFSRYELTDAGGAAVEKLRSLLDKPVVESQYEGMTQDQAPVAVVIPERQIVPDNLMAGLTRKWCEGWNDALEEVARLNGVKP